MTTVAHTAHAGTTAYLARSLETGDTAVIVTTPIRDRVMIEGLLEAPVAPPERLWECRTCLMQATGPQGLGVHTRKMHNRGLTHEEMVPI